MTQGSSLAVSHLNIAVIGGGNWGKNHIRVLHELGVLYAVCDLDAYLASDLSHQYGVPRYSLDKILMDDKIDGVVIATPVSSHFSIASACLKAKKHVFVEKPLTLCLDESKQLCDMAKAHSRILMVGHLLHYHNAYRTLKTFKEDGTLGKIQYIYSNRLNLGKFRCEENIWWSFAPHDVSMILGLMGKMPKSVSAMGAKYLHHTVADVTTTHLSFSEGERAHIFVSWLHPYKEQKLVVIGEKAMAIFDDGLPWDKKLSLHPYPVEWVDGLPKPSQSQATPVALTPLEPLKEEALHYLTCIIQGTQPITCGQEGLSVISILNAAEISMNTQQTVQLDSNTDFSLPKNYFAHATSTIDTNCTIGDSTKIWHYSHVLENTHIGQQCNIGQNASIGPNVTIGNGCKIQNNVSVFQGVTLEDEVFIGPSVTFTNVNTPRAFISRKDKFLPTVVKKGATIGANATIVCGHTLGEYCFVAAGAVVTRDVPAHALVAGVPARQVGWVSHDGVKLNEDLKCPRTGKVYNFVEQDDALVKECSH